MAYNPKTWTEGTVVKPARVVIDGVEHEVLPEERTGATSLTPEDMNNIEKAISDVGSVVITSTNTNPSNRLGGTWELIDKEFKSYLLNSKDFFTPSDNIEDYSCSIIRTGHSVKAIMSYSAKETITDDAFIIGTLNFEKIGINGTAYTRRFLGMNDSSTSIVYHTLNYSTGVLQTVDVVPNNITSGTTTYVQFEIDVPQNYMLESVCDKFYWKRTA